MGSISIRDARKKLGHLLKAVERGESVVITRRGVDVARIVPIDNPEKKWPKLPDLAEFRAAHKVKGLPLSKTVIALRRAERY